MDLSRSGKSQFDYFQILLHFWICVCLHWLLTAWFGHILRDNDSNSHGHTVDFCRLKLWQKQKRPKCENLSAKKHVFSFSPPLTNWLKYYELKTLVRSDGVSLPPSATVPPWLEAGTVRESPIRGGNCTEPRCCVVAEGFRMVTYLHICAAFFFFKQFKR